jgi:hypothetical protein
MAKVSYLKNVTGWYEQETSIINNRSQGDVVCLEF